MWGELALPWMLENYPLPLRLNDVVVQVTERLLSSTERRDLDGLIASMLTFTPDEFETRVLSLEVTEPSDAAFVDVEVIGSLVALRHRVELWLSALQEVLDDDLVRELVAWAKKAGDEEGIDPDWIYWPSWLPGSS
ncbi:MAG: hypothetical protein IT175_09440 [Acidobacteria bacterium]|nr:hypothetical protein [Acidobacteriota bacterium]